MQVKVVCLNLWEGGKLFPQILAFLGAVDADILMLQEVYAGTDPHTPINYRSLDVLREKLPYAYCEFAPAVLDIGPEGKVIGGNAILSKYHLSPKKQYFLTNPLENVSPMILGDFQLRLAICNTL